MIPDVLENHAYWMTPGVLGNHAHPVSYRHI
jgi:hypothetical protein